MNQPATPQPPPAPVIWGESNVGRQRTHNEDQVYPDTRHKTSLRLPSPQALQTRGYLLAVADGIGGAQVGDTAANFAIRTVVDHYYADPRSLPLDQLLQSAVELANTNVYNYVKTSPAIQQAGCTLTAAAIRGSELFVAHVGDSRAYLVQEGALYPLTTDHNVAQMMAAGQGPPGAQALAGNMLLRSLGAEPTVAVDIKRFLLKPGDTVLVCSDGLHSVVTNDEIRQIASRETPQKGARKLIDLANDRGGPDNISVAIARLPGGAAPAAALGGALSPRILALAIGVLALLGVLAVTYVALSRPQEGQETATAPAAVEVIPATPGEEATAPPATATLAATGTPAGVAVAPVTPTEALGVTATAAGERAPTSTLVPTPTPTPTPRPRPTNTPILFVQPTDTQGGGLPGPTSPPSAPALASPLDMSQHRDRVRLQWFYPKGLQERQAYQVLLRTEQNQPQQALRLTADNPSIDVRFDDNPDFFKDDSTVYFWSVQVISASGAPASLPSSEWRFIFRRETSPPPATNTPRPTNTPDPTPTDTPKPIPTFTPAPAETGVNVTRVAFGGG